MFKVCMQAVALLISDVLEPQSVRYEGNFPMQEGDG